MTDITLDAFRASRLSGTPAEFAIAETMKKWDWDLQGDTNRIHLYSAGGQNAVIEERNRDGDKFAYLFLHPCDVYAPTLAEAEVELVRWINGEQD